MRVFTEEHKKKLSESHKGQRAWNKGLRKGDHPSMENIGFKSGEDNPMWCGGDSDKERRNSDYKNWRIDVFKRDKFVCRECGYYNGCGELRKDLNAHHIIRWIDDIELRYVVNNGVTLCVPCHIKEHTDIN
jgi:hypothetical protein